MAYAQVNDTVMALEARQASLRCAQNAERGAQASAHREVRKETTTRKDRTLSDLKKAVQSEFTPYWRELFKIQKAERQELEAASKNAFGRLRHLVKNVRNRNFFDGGGAVSGAFKWIVKGEAATASFEKHQVKQRKEFARKQSQTLRDQCVVVTKEFKTEFDQLWKDELRDRDLLLDRQKLDRNAVDTSLNAAREKSKATSRGDTDKTRQQSDVAKSPYQRAQELERRGLGAEASERFAQTKSETVKLPSRAERLAEAKAKVAAAFRNRPDNGRSR